MADEEKPSGYPVKALSKAVKDAKSSKKPPTSKDDTGDDKGPKQIIRKVDPRQFVDINPQLVDDKLRGVNESRSATKIDYLIRNGLGDQDHLTYYRKVISNPKVAVTNPNLRKYVGEVLEDLLEIVFNDPQTYNRVRTILQKDRKVEDALIVKAYKSGIDLQILKEVYQRGLSEGNDETAFNRVNSFIAGGKARKLDADLLEPDPLESPGGVGSDEVTKRYADMTPGQSFNLIKKALRGKDND